MTIAVPSRREPPILRPGSGGYDQARAAWNLAADLRPAAVSVVSSASEVQAVLRRARDAELRVAAVSTGHSAGAMPDLDGALMLRLTRGERPIEVDASARIVRIPAGATWGEVVDAVAPHGLAVMHGSSPSVGVVGYVLGGGLSFYARRHGLAANHVRAFEVVTPDAIARRVDATHDPELFDALRGGGGAFAVVTAVELGLLPYAEVTGGAMFFAAEEAGRVLRTWRDWTITSEDSITTTFRLLVLPPAPDVPEPLRCVATVCIDGVALGAGPAEALEARLNMVARPILGGFGPMPSAAVVRLHGDPETPVPAVLDGTLLRELDDDAIRAFLRVAGAGSGSPLVSAELRQLGGALARPPAGSGARGHLDGAFLLNGIGIPGAPAAAADLHAHLDRLLDAMRPWDTGARFLSFAEREHRLAACIPAPALEAARRVSSRVDPGGLLLAPQMP